MTKAAIDKSSANDPVSLSHKKTNGGVSTHGDSRRKSNGEMQRVRALIDCGGTGIFMTPSLLK
jgi:hypothetical protein